LTAFLSGCTSAAVNDVTSVKKLNPTPGYVDMVAVEGAEPESVILRTVNREIGVGNRYSALSVVQAPGLDVQRYFTTMLNAGAVGVENGPEVGQENRFNTVSANVLDGLNKRLLAAEDLQSDALRSENLAIGKSKLSLAASTLEAQAAEQTNEFKVDASRIASLRMQIAAMKLDQNPPPTAPSGHWASIEAQKDMELAELLKSYDANIEAIFSARDRLLADESAKVYQQINDSVTAGRNAADAARLASLDIAKQRFDKEQTQLNQEDARVFEDAELIVSSQYGSLGATFDTKVPLPRTLAGRDDGRAALLKYRDQLQQRIRVAADRSVRIVAAKLNIRIVKKQPGVANLTPVFIEAVQAYRWKVS
jgi:hypothetical protein